MTETQKKYWNYKNILIIDKEANAYTTDGEKIVLNNNIYFNDVVTNKEKYISTTQMIDNKECIMLAVPLHNMKIAGKEMLALAASYEPSTFDKTLSMTFFEGQAFSYIISKSGTTIVRSSASQALKTGYNVLTTIQESTLDVGCSMDDVRLDMQLDREGQMGFTQNGERYYMTYIPIEEDWYLLTFVPTKAVTEKSDMLLKITLLICGLIITVFSGLIAFIIYIFYQNKRKLELMAYVDEVTGGNTIQKFYDLASFALMENGHPEYALIYTNLSKFKVLNEQLGRNTCDFILKSFSTIMSAALKNKECMGHLSGDNFCVLMEYIDEETLSSRFEELYKKAQDFTENEKPVWSLPLVEFGVYVIENDSLQFPQMIDRAKLALRESSRSINSRIRCAFYNDMVRRVLFREKQLEDMMEQALKMKEFQVYLQPKYSASTQEIGGAEALVRWQTSTEGMIFPDEFIPLFEQNGFVVQLDLFVFEEVCIRIRSWIDKGYKPVKISVNCSRVHLKNADFLNDYRKIFEKYNIPAKLIEIELTESIVMENSEYLMNIIEKIHDIGFYCSMDDFGSGYSSLNLLQSIPVDTLKIDKIFFQNNINESNRAKSVVSSIVSMAKALSMETVAEGVEYSEQVEMLKNMGCDLIQGYIFAKPMPFIEFEKKVFNQVEVSVLPEK